MLDKEHKDSRGPVIATWSALCFWLSLSLVRSRKLREKCSFSWCWSLICQKRKVFLKITPWEQNSTECRSPTNQISTVLKVVINETSHNEALVGWFTAPFVCWPTWCRRKNGFTCRRSRHWLGSIVLAPWGTNFCCLTDTPLTGKGSSPPRTIWQLKSAKVPLLISSVLSRGHLLSRISYFWSGSVDLCGSSQASFH